MNAITITQELNAEALRQAIDGVEDNSHINDGRWSDWDNARHVAETYGVELCEEGVQIIERAIANSGKSLKIDLPAAELAVWGQNFAGSFWDR